VSTREARQIQADLRGRVNVCPLAHLPHVIAGVDVSVKRRQARAAVVCFSLPELAPLEAVTAELPATFPYVPGLLAFREGPVVLAALAALRHTPDLLIFDAQGQAHPRRMGLASHLGVLLDVPSIGCAKSRLVGAYEPLDEQRGAWQPLVDEEEVIGAVLRTRARVRPVFVSVGHRIDLETAVALVLACALRYRLPEPTRWAHRVAGGACLPTARAAR